MFPTPNHNDRPLEGARASAAKTDFRENLLRLAAQWKVAGCAVHPVKTDGSKMPLSVLGAGKDGRAGWKKLSTGEHPLPPFSWLQNVLRSNTGIGIFCGAVSGNLEMVELEGRAVHLLEQLRATAEHRGLLELWERFDAGCSELTPSGGIHWYSRTIDGPTLGNTKLAEHKVAGGVDCLAETRGEGGWSVCAGSYGAVHKSGKPYTTRTGSPAGIVQITCAERDALHDLFRTLGDCVTAPKKVRAVLPAGDRGTLAQPGDDYNATASWADILTGWTPQQIDDARQHWTRPGKSDGSTSATTTTASPSVLWVFSSSTNIPAGESLSKFAAYCHLNHGGDFSAGSRALRALGYGAAQTSGIVRVESPPETAEPIALDSWRAEVNATLAIERDRVGLKLLRGGCGTGKTYAVAQKTAQLKRGVTSVPGHELAAGIVKILHAHGAKAVAYPPLNPTTCANYAVAEVAISNGLTVGATVCPDCPSADNCKAGGYVALVALADKAAHKVCTHERLARSHKRLLKGAGYLTIEEDPAPLLAPTVHANRRQLEAVASMAEDIAGVEQALAGESGEAFLSQNESAAFFDELQRVAESISDELTRARKTLPPGMHPLPLPRVAATQPRNPEALIHRAIENLGVEVDRDALRLAVRAITGGLDSLWVQVEEGDQRRRKKDYTPPRSAVAVGCWRTALPFESLPVVVCDATTTHEQLERLSGVEVQDITPTGEPVRVHPATQYAEDVTRATSPAVVASMIVGICYARPEMERVAVLLLKPHWEAVFGVDPVEDLLPADVRRRIVWHTFYGSGADRGSNIVHSVAQMLLVIGTVRPRPADVRRRLIQWGLPVAAGMAVPQWGTVSRSEVEKNATAGGTERLGWSGRGYAEHDWQMAAESITLAATLQAVGRARGICVDGIPVVVVSTEQLGLPVHPGTSLPRIGFNHVAVLNAMNKVEPPDTLSLPKEGKYLPTFANSIIRESEQILFVPTTLPEIERTLAPIAPGTVRRWVAQTVEQGLIARHGSARSTYYTLGPPAITTAPPAPVEVAEPLELLEARRVSAELVAAMPLLARAVEVFGGLAMVAPAGAWPPPRAPREVRKLLLPAIDFITSTNRRQAMGHIGTGPDRITFKVTVTSPRGRLIPAGEARAVAAWRAQQASP